jgi:hypothetical protein
MFPHTIIEELLDLYSVLPEVVKGGHVRTLSEFRTCKRTETGEREWNKSLATD